MPELSTTGPVEGEARDPITTDALVREIAAAPLASEGSIALVPGTVIDGAFDVRREIGRGGMGVVFEAYDRDLDRTVAVKLHLGAEPRALARLRAEARAMARVVHPNVLAVHAVGLWEGRLYIAMEFAPGGSLRRWLAHRRDTAAVLEVMLAAGRGLIAAHDAGIVHRDFKPDNVLLDGAGTAKVADFGLAQAAGEAALPGATASDVGVTRGGGTPGYMAPEQLCGEPSDARADQFAYCVALFEALAGERPFETRPLATLPERIAAVELSNHATRRVPPEVIAVVRRGLATRPEARFDDMHALVHALQLAAAAPVRRRRRHRVVATIAALAATSAMGWAVWPAATVTDACADAGSRFQRSWSSDRVARIDAAFDSLDVAYAPDTWARAYAGIDNYVEDAVAAAREVCSLGGSADVVAAEACLAADHRALSRLLTRFDAPDEDVVRHAVEWVHGLPAVRSCREPSLVALWTPPPEDAASRAELEAIELAITDVEDRSRRASPVPLVEVAELVARAERLGHPPTTSWALRTQSNRYEREGDVSASVATLRRAFDIAIAARARREAVLAAMALAAVLARYELGHERVAEWTATARALEPALDDPSVRAALDANAAIAVSRQDPAAAAAGFASALAQLRSVDPDDPELASLMANLGRAAITRGDSTEARRWFEEAGRHLRRVLGDHHPARARNLVDLATVDLGTSDAAAAIAKLREADELLRGSEIDRVDRRILLERLAIALRQVGEVDAAAAHGRQAYALALEIYPAGHHARTEALFNLGVQLIEAAAADEAIETLGAAVPALGDDDPRVDAIHRLLARAWLAKGDPDAAVRQAELAVRSGKSNPRGNAVDQYALGEMLHAAGRDREAIVAYELGLASEKRDDDTQVWHARGELAALRLADPRRSVDAVEELHRVIAFFATPPRDDEDAASYFRTVLDEAGVEVSTARTTAQLPANSAALGTAVPAVPR